VLLNEKERYVQEAECYIIEEIVNNLNLTIHCKIRPHFGVVGESVGEVA